MERSDRFTEIFKLDMLLNQEKIEHVLYNRSYGDFEFYQICCPNNGEERYLSAIEGVRNFWFTRRQNRNNGAFN